MQQGGCHMTNWAGCACRRLDAADSTNRLARQWAREGAPHGAVVVAREQTAGRGRRGRDWASAPDKGLWLSIVLHRGRLACPAQLIPFAAALAVADACREVGGVDAQIKWPNDVLAGGKKIAGILAEVEGEAIIAGIGINANHESADFPEDLRARAGSIHTQGGRMVELRALEHALLQGLRAYTEAENLLEEYTRRCITLGAGVTVVEPTRSYAGVALSLDGDGALLVRDDAGEVHRVLAGDVSIRGLMGYA